MFGLNQESLFICFCTNSTVTERKSLDTAGSFIRVCLIVTSLSLYMRSGKERAEDPVWLFKGRRNLKDLFAVTEAFGAREVSECIHTVDIYISHTYRDLSSFMC